MVEPLKALNFTSKNRRGLKAFNGGFLHDFEPIRSQTLSLFCPKSSFNPNCCEMLWHKDRWLSPVIASFMVISRKVLTERDKRGTV